MKKIGVVIGVGVVIIAIIGVAIYAMHNTNTPMASTNSTPTYTTAPTSIYATVSATPSSTATISVTPTPTQVASNSIYTLKSSSSVGAYLADTKGKTLYTSTGDSTGVSTCSGLCAATWPIYKPGSTSNLPTNITIITRSDGTKQYAWKGYPLYYYVGDISAGDVNGNGVGGFYVAK